MRFRVAILLLVMLSAGCASGEGAGPIDLNVDADGMSRLRPLDHVGTWVPNPNIEEALYGTWSGSTTLSLGEDGRYSFESLIGFDEGEYRVRAKAGILRLATDRGSGFCADGDVNRLDYSLETHPSGDAQRLSFEHRINRCGSTEFPGHLDRIGDDDEVDFVGEWRRHAVFTLSSNGRYSLDTDLGADEGTFEYNDRAGQMVLVTDADGLCPAGSTATIRILTSVNVPIGALVVLFQEDECYERSGMTQWMTKTAS